jgi:hypothetical protein
MPLSPELRQTFLPFKKKAALSLEITFSNGTISFIDATSI